MAGPVWLAAASVAACLILAVDDERCLEHGYAQATRSAPPPALPPNVTAGRPIGVDLFSLLAAATPYERPSACSLEAIYPPRRRAFVLDQLDTSLHLRRAIRLV